MKSVRRVVLDLAAGLAFLMLTSGLALAAGPGRLLLPMTLKAAPRPRDLAMRILLRSPGLVACS